MDAAAGDGGPDVAISAAVMALRSVAGRVLRLCGTREKENSTADPLDQYDELVALRSCLANPLAQECARATERLRAALNPPPRRGRSSNGVLEESAAAENADTVQGEDLAVVFGDPLCQLAYIARLFVGRALCTEYALHELLAVLKCSDAARPEDVTALCGTSAATTGALPPRVVLLGGGCAPESIGISRFGASLADQEAAAASASAWTHARFDVFDTAAEWEAVVESLPVQTSFVQFDLRDPTHAARAKLTGEASDLVVASFVLVELLRGTRKAPSRYKGDLVEMLVATLATAGGLLVLDVSHPTPAAQIQDALEQVAKRSGRTLFSCAPAPFHTPPEAIQHLQEILPLPCLRGISVLKTRAWFVGAAHEER
jgi:hypothetical protein